MTDRVAGADARVLVALCRLERPYVRDLAAAAGLTLQPTHAALRRLRDAGLVTWEDRAQGTLRPTFEVAWPAYTLEAVHG